ncbi:hypothetical protein M0D21_20620 [Aquimarina sp. D1M17]|uniref:hypothetical protein n=1 Tax=Aquimarina acroporae TaxID=2937283 RepID=UPI0020BEBB60|nr:hypothetical protein [Aquimarina acroporae]MCK8523993.1 hypothetical protein [Aquimarina acroporae]
MKTENYAYQLFYFTSLLFITASIFMEHLSIFLKPVVLLLLSAIYILRAEHKNALVLIAMGVILVAEVLSMKDFIRYFRVLNVLLSVYYLLNIILLWKSLKKIKIRLNKVFTVQLIITMALIVYVLASVAGLILPSVYDDRMYLVILILFFTVFVCSCYYIYLNSKTVVSSSLMVAASCFLIVNIITALYKLYVFLEVFMVIGNLLQVFGQFFLVKFFIEQHKLTPNEEDFF